MALIVPNKFFNYSLIVPYLVFKVL